MKHRAEEEAAARRRAEEAQRLALEKERDAAKAAAEAEGRIKEGRENADIKMKQLLEVADADRKKLMEALELGFKRVGEGVSSVLDDQSRMAALAGGVALLAVGVYGAREGARLARTCRSVRGAKGSQAQHGGDDEHFGGASRALSSSSTQRLAAHRGDLAHGGAAGCELLLFLAELACRAGGVR